MSASVPYGPLPESQLGPASGLQADDARPAVSALAQRTPERWRLVAAGAIVAVVVAAIWLWGRPASGDASVLVAVTAEAWVGGQPPGAFDLVAVAADVGARLAAPEAVLDSVVAYDVPAGTFVAPALLAAPAELSGEFTSMQFAADSAAWPSPGPHAGSHAVIATALGGCALDVVTLADGGDGYIVVRLDAGHAGRYAAAAELDGLVVWPAPPDGWPLCPQRGASAVVVPARPRSGDGPPGLGPSEFDMSGSAPSGVAFSNQPFVGSTTNEGAQAGGAARGTPSSARPHSAGG